MEERPDGDRPLFAPPSPPSPPEGDAPPRRTDDPSSVEPGPPAAAPPASPPLFGPGQGGAGGSLFARPQAAPRRPAPDAAPRPPSGRTARRIDLGGAAPPPGDPPGAPPPGPPPGPPPPGAASPSAGPPPTSGGGQGAPPDAVVAPPAERTPGSRLVGRVEGNVSVEPESRGLRGVRVLVVAGALAAALLAARWALDTQQDLPVFLREAIVALFVVAGALVLIGSGFGISPVALLRAFADGGREDGDDGAPRTGLRDLRPRDPGWPRATTAVRRFRLRAMSGELVSCVLSGRPEGNDVRSGDHLLVEGRRRRNGQVVVRRAEVLQGPAGPSLRVVEGRPAASSVVVAVADWACLAVGLAVFAWVVVDLLGR